MSDTKELLLRISIELEKKADFYRKHEHDPHGINTALYVAMAEVCHSIRTSLHEAPVAPPITQMPIKSTADKEEFRHERDM